MSVSDTPLSHPSDLDKVSMGEKFVTIIQEMPEGDITLMEILVIFEDDGLLLLSIFLSLVFLVPVSIPGVSTVFGSAILLVGVARLFNRHLWLPKRISERTISSEKLAAGLKKALPWFQKLEKISKPHRLPWLSTNGKIRLVNKLGFILAALLLMVPFGFVPFSNTLPALALIFFAIGEIEKDGNSILLGHLTNVATIIYFAILVAGGGYTIFEGLRLLPF